MKKLYAAALAVLFVLALAASPGRADAEAAPRTITVQGESSFSVAPDQASVEIGIETTGKTADAAAQSNAAVMAAVQNALSAAGIAEKNMKTASYNFYPVYNKDNNQSIDGYRAENSITVTTDDISQVGEIIDISVKNGANNVDSVKFGLKDAQKYRDSALKSAVRDAKSKAAAVAGELGKSIVNVVSASESNIYVENYRSPNISLKAMSADMMAATPINAKDLEVSAKITVTFEIN